MRKVIIAFGIIVVLILIGALVVPSFIDVNRYRPQLEAKLQDRLGRDVSLGPMKLSIVPLGFRAENVVIGEDPKFNTGRPFVEVQTFYVRPELFPLLRHDVQISSLQLSRPVVELVRNAQGVWNFSSLIPEKQSQRPNAFSLDKLKIYDGQIAITDFQQRKPRALYDHIDLLVYDFAPDKAFSVETRAHLPGSGNQAVVLQGKIGPVERNNVVRTPLDAKLELDGVSFSGLQRFINAALLADSDAVLTGSGVVKNSNGSIASTGSFEARNPRLRGVEIGYPISVDYDINANVNNSTATIHKTNVKLGQTPVSFQGSINAQPSPPQIDVSVQSSNASIAEAARLAAALGVAFNNKSDVSGNLNVNVHAKGPLTKPELNGQVTARQLRVSGGDLREPVQVDVIDLALSPDAIRSNEFTAKTGHTSASAQFALVGYSSANPKLETRLNTGNAEVQELLRIAHAYGISAMEGVNGSGSITLNITASGPLHQPEQFTYTGSGAIRNASMSVPSIAKPLAIRRADLQFSADVMSLDNLDFSMGQTNATGNLRARNLTAPQVQFSIAANHIDVADWEQMFKASEKKPSKPDGLLSRATGSGLLTAGTIVYDELKLTNVRSSVTVDRGIITMKPLSADLYSGQQSGTIAVDTRGTPATYTVDSRLQGVDANQLLSALSPVKQTLFGVLSANADTHFTTAAGARSILPSLTGKVSLHLNNGKIANVDLLHQLASIAQFQQTARAIEPFTQLIQLTGDFDINHGVARTNNLRAAIDAGSIAATGTVDLAQQRLNLHLTAVLSQPYSQTVGGTSIGGFLNTALANNKGELVIPVLVTGTFQDPSFAPDLEKVAQMKVQNLLPGLDNPAGFTERIFGEILRGKPESDQNRQSEPLRDFFDLFKKNQQRP